MGLRLTAVHAHSGPGRRGGVQDVIGSGFISGRTEILGENDAGPGQELTSPGDAGPGRLAGIQGRPGELRKAGLGVNFHDAVPGLPYPPVDLEDLGLQGERLTGDALPCQAGTEGGG